VTHIFCIFLLRPSTAFIFKYHSSSRNQKDSTSLGFLSDRQIPGSNKYTENVGVGTGINKRTIRQSNSAKNGNYFI